MALRVCSKITSGIIQNFCRQLSAKADLASSVVTAKDVAKKDEASPPKPQVYSLGQMQSLNLNKKYNTQQVSSEIEMARKNIENQSLQPSMLPNYYENTMDLGMPFSPEDTSDPQRSSEMYRTFRKSETYSKVTLPLRPSKLASPFPDPVKVMQSHTVSDEEKAAQMLADSRATKNFQKQDQKNYTFVPNRSFSTSAARKKGSKDSMVSTDPKKCKKVKTDDGKKVCRKMKLPGCESPKRISCKREPMVVKCKKQEAPYPSYSESCHEDIDEKPSECKLCPWKPDQHPHFRPKRNEFHTAITKQAQEQKQKESISGSETTEGEVLAAIPESLETQQLASNEDGGPEETASANNTLQLQPLSYQCDLRKKPCKRPKRGTCADRSKKSKRGKKGRKGGKGKKHKKHKRGKDKKGKKKQKKKRKDRRGGKRRTKSWSEATRELALRGGALPATGPRMDWLERDLQQNQRQAQMEMLMKSDNKSDRRRGKVDKLRKKGKEGWKKSQDRGKKTVKRITEKRKDRKDRKKTVGWSEAARVWAQQQERTNGMRLAPSATAMLHAFRSQDFHEVPPLPDLNHEVGAGISAETAAAAAADAQFMETTEVSSTQQGNNNMEMKKKGKKTKKKKGKKDEKKKGKKKKKNKKPKCKKFPMGDCTPPKRKGRQSQQGGCPPKKKKKLVKDCPPVDDDGGCRNTSQWGVPIGEYNLPSREMMEQPYMRLFADDDRKKDCPKPDFSIAKDSDIKPCPKKRNESKVCPGSLLRKKRRNKYRGRKKKDKDASSRSVFQSMSLDTPHTPSDTTATRRSTVQL